MMNDGGPAFPVLRIDGFQGLSVRDYFAAAALPAVFATVVKAGERFALDIAPSCYAIADAMLAERTK